MKATRIENARAHKHADCPGCWCYAATCVPQKAFTRDGLCVKHRRETFNRRQHDAFMARQAGR